MFVLGATTNQLGCPGRLLLISKSSESLLSWPFVDCSDNCLRIAKRVPMKLSSIERIRRKVERIVSSRPPSRSQSEHKSVQCNSIRRAREMYSALNHKWTSISSLLASEKERWYEPQYNNHQNEETKWFEGAEPKGSKLLALRSFVFRHQRITCQRVASCILRARYAEFWAGRSVCRVV